MTFSLFGCPLRGQRARKNPRGRGREKKNPLAETSGRGRESGVACNMLQRPPPIVERNIFVDAALVIAGGIESYEAAPVIQVNQEVGTLGAFVSGANATNSFSDNTNHK